VGVCVVPVVLNNEINSPMILGRGGNFTRRLGDCHCKVVFIVAQDISIFTLRARLAHAMVRFVYMA
jgi:hypothetical protein